LETSIEGLKYEFEFEYMIRTSKIRTSFNIPNALYMKLEIVR